MPNQPTPITPLAATLLAVSVLSSTALAGMVTAQAIVPVHPYLGSGPLLGFIATVSGCGFITQLAVGRVTRRIDQIEAKLEQQSSLVDPEAAAAARRLNLRLLNTPN